MDFSNIDFTYDCYVDLHVDGYGSLSGMFYTSKTNLIFLAQLFKESHDWKPSFERDGKQYVMGFVDAGDLRFKQFMDNVALLENSRPKSFIKKMVSTSKHMILSKFGKTTILAMCKLVFQKEGNSL